ncbi:MAG: hypothetical protein U1E45_01745 [Geminicoccaceae bacterium]
MADDKIFAVIAMGSLLIWLLRDRIARDPVQRKRLETGVIGVVLAGILYAVILTLTRAG